MAEITTKEVFFPTSNSFFKFMSDQMRIFFLVTLAKMTPSKPKSAQYLSMTFTVEGQHCASSGHIMWAFCFREQTVVLRNIFKEPLPPFSFKAPNPYTQHLELLLLLWSLSVMPISEHGHCFPFPQLSVPSFMETGVTTNNGTKMIVKLRAGANKKRHSELTHIHIKLSSFHWNMYNPFAATWRELWYFSFLKSY